MSTGSLIELVVTWLPLLALVIVWVWVMKFGNKQYKAHVAEVNAVNAEILATNREMLAELRQIKQGLEDRKS